MDKKQIYPSPYPTKVHGLEVDDIRRIIDWIKEQGYNPYDVDSLVKCNIHRVHKVRRCVPDERLTEYEV